MLLIKKLLLWVSIEPPIPLVEGHLSIFQGWPAWLQSYQFHHCHWLQTHCHLQPISTHQPCSQCKGWPFQESKNMQKKSNLWTYHQWILKIEPVLIRQGQTIETRRPKKKPIVVSSDHSRVFCVVFAPLDYLCHQFHQYFILY